MNKEELEVMRQAVEINEQRMASALKTYEECRSDWINANNRYMLALSDNSFSMPRKQRRAQSNIVFDIASTSLTTEIEDAIDKPTELESLLMSYFKTPRSRLNKKIKALLNESIICDGAIYESLEALYNKDTNFASWCRYYLKSFKENIKDANINMAVYGLRKFNTPKYGWLEYKKSLKDNADSSIITNKFNYVD